MTSLKQCIYNMLFFLACVCGEPVIIKRHNLEEPYEAEVQCLIKRDVGKECYPQTCRRKIIDGLFPEEEIDALHDIVNKGMATRKEIVGGPTLLDINTGFVRDSTGVENLFSLTRKGGELFTPDDFAVYGKIIHKLKQVVETEMGGVQKLFFTSPTFITRLTHKAAQDVHDEYWHTHADRNNTAHYHYSGLLYMSTFEKDFQGGRLIFPSSYSSEDEEGEPQLIVEPKRGRVILFTSGHENPHRVEQVTSGNRFTLSFWFTCDVDRQFNIFLDGQEHREFSRHVGKQYDNQEAQRKKKEEL